MPGYDIFPIIGQSGSTDRGEGPFTDGFESRDNRIRQLGRGAQDMQVINVGNWIGAVKWGGLHHWNVTAFDKLGFALPFARRVVQYELETGRTVLLVPCGFGGTSILDWLEISGELTNLTPDFRARVDYALALPGGTNRIAGVLFHQGERNLSDAIAGNADAMSAAAYRLLRRQFIKVKIRGRYPGSYPIITSLLCPSYRAGHALKAEFEQAILDASADDGNTLVASVTGLLSNAEKNGGDDFTHFCAESSWTLGYRMFQLFHA